MPQNLTNVKSALAQVVAWWQQTITWAKVDPDLCHWVTLRRRDIEKEILSFWRYLYNCKAVPVFAKIATSWRRHQMETFYALLVLCVGNSPVTGEFPTQRPVTRRFDIFYDLRLNKPLSKQSWGWWFETPSRSLWRHCNVQCSQWQKFLQNDIQFPIQWMST